MRIARALAVLAALALAAGPGACKDRPGSTAMSTDQSPLYLDLSGDHHDAMFCAMSYVVRQGGPALVGSPADTAALRANRARMLAWLSAQPNRDALVAGYPAFKTAWSPVYPD
jgi:hypothetical protein